MNAHSIEVVGSTAGQFLPFFARGIAKILLADADAASRLTLKSILEAAGYDVDLADSLDEATRRLETGDYELVMADLPGGDGPALLKYARQRESDPATALLYSKVSGIGEGNSNAWQEGIVRMSAANVSHVIAGVAELLGERADRRIGLSLRRIV